MGGSANASEDACLDAAGKKTWAVPAAGKQKSGQKDGTSGITGFPGSREKQKLESEINVKKASVSSYATSGHYGSLARAGTKGQVQKVLGDVHRSIGNLRLAACFGDEEERLSLIHISTTVMNVSCCITQSWIVWGISYAKVSTRDFLKMSVVCGWIICVILQIVTFVMFG